MTIEKAYEYIDENWDDFVKELIEENLEFLLEYEDLDEYDVDQYEYFDELPSDLQRIVWLRQAEHIQNELHDYANWYAARNSEEVV